MIELTPEQFRKILPTICDRETSQDAENWNSDNPLWGHCAVVSLVAQNLFGGELMRASLAGTPYESAGSHYWNRLPDGTFEDFTAGQFDAYPDLKEAVVRTRDYVLFDPKTGKPREIMSRYKLLAFRLAHAVCGSNPLFYDEIYRKCFFAALDSPCQKMKFGCVIVYNGEVVYSGCNKFIEGLRSLCEPKCVRLAIPSRTESMLGACGHAEEGMWEVIHKGIPIHECDLYVAGLYANGLPWMKSEAEHTCYTCLRCAVQMNYARIRSIYVPVVNQWRRMTTEEALKTAVLYATKEKKA